MMLKKRTFVCFLNLMKNRKAAIGFILVTVLVDVIGVGIIIPVVPALITELTGGSISDASIWGGWLMFAYALMQFVCAPIVGALSDQYGRRPVLLLSLLGFGLDYILAGFAPTFKASCENHGGTGSAAIQQWDAKAKQWNIVSKFYEPLRDVTGPLIEADSAAYAAENNVTPRDC